MAPVTGAVTLDGKPFAAGKVMFAPVAQGDSAKAGKPAMGQLSPEGTYELSTYGSSDGAIVGNHWITVIQTVIPNNPPGSDPNTAESVKFLRYKLPQVQSVTAGQENTINIELTSAMLSQ
jgi:hypothetical protein